MFCTKCGKELNSGDRFCAHCGTEVRTAQPQFHRYEDVVFNPPFKMEAEKKTAQIIKDREEYTGFAGYTEKESVKRPVEKMNISWNLEGFPGTQPRKVEEASFNWEDVLEKKNSVRRESSETGDGFGEKELEALGILINREAEPIVVEKILPESDTLSGSVEDDIPDSFISREELEAELFNDVNDGREKTRTARYEPLKNALIDNSEELDWYFDRVAEGGKNAGEKETLIDGKAFVKLLNDQLRPEDLSSSNDIELSGLDEAFNLKGKEKPEAPETTERKTGPVERRTGPFGRRTGPFRAALGLDEAAEQDAAGTEKDGTGTVPFESGILASLFGSAFSGMRNSSRTSGKETEKEQDVKTNDQEPAAEGAKDVQEAQTTGIVNAEEEIPYEGVSLEEILPRELFESLEPDEKTAETGTGVGDGKEEIATGAAEAGKTAGQSDKFVSASVSATVPEKPADESGNTAEKPAEAAETGRQPDESDASFEETDETREEPEEEAKSLEEILAAASANITRDNSKFYTFDVKNAEFKQLLETERQRLEKLGAEYKPQNRIKEERARAARETSFAGVALTTTPLAVDATGNVEKIIEQVQILETGGERSEAPDAVIVRADSSVKREADTRPVRKVETASGTEAKDPEGVSGRKPADPYGEEKLPDKRELHTHREEISSKDVSAEILSVEAGSGDEEQKPKKTSAAIASGKEEKFKDRAKEIEEFLDSVENEKPNRHILGKILIAILVLLIVCEGAILVAKFTAPEGQIAQYSDKIMGKVVELVNGLMNKAEKDPEEQNTPSPDAEVDPGFFWITLLSDRSGNIKTIGDVVYSEDSSLKYDSIKTMAFEEAETAEPFEDGEFYSDDKGNSVTYAECLIDNILTYYESWQENNTNKKLVGINKLEIGDVRRSGDNFYVLTRTTIAKADGSEKISCQTVYVQAAADSMTINSIKEEVIGE